MGVLRKVFLGMLVQDDVACFSSCFVVKGFAVLRVIAAGSERENSRKKFEFSRHNFSKATGSRRLPGDSVPMWRFRDESLRA